MKTETKPNLMSATWTKAALVRRQFKAGRQRKEDLEYDTERAVLESRVIFLKIRAAMSSAGIVTHGDDVRVALAMMTPDTSPEDRVFLVPIGKMENLAKTYAEASKVEAENEAVPLGAIVWQRDREAGGATYVWAQPWRVNGRAARATLAANEAFEESEGKRTEASF